ncbi:MAG TPA: S46 family peptidase [Longibacter sp.]
MRKTFTSGLALLLTALLLAGCGPSRETATVATVTETAPSTEAEAPEPEPVTVVPTGFDTVTAQRFDRGKMWTFENAPIDYFEEEYGFRPDETWFRKARLGALRIPGCSASFVSPHGLVMTNHHCGRESVSQVSQESEALLDNGFYAKSLEDERKVPDFYVEQLVEIEDVTEKVNRRLQADNDTRGRNRERQIQQMQAEMTQEAKRRNEDLSVEIVALYSGARYSAYTYERFDDVRLVMAPELSLGFFGGAPDNFTYPRYTLDVTFFRAYNDDGEPMTPKQHFSWDEDGSAAGDPVFVVGNPGSTSRLSTVSQLKFTRDHSLPGQLDVLVTRAKILEPYIEDHPEKAEEYGLRNTFFSIDNSVKNYRGQLRGLRDPYLIARRAKAEKALQDSIMSVDSLRSRYGNVLEEIEQLQRSKRVAAEKNNAFAAFSATSIGSRVLTRAVYGYFYDTLKRRGAAPDRLEDIREDAMNIKDWPAEVEAPFIAARLREIRSAFGPNDPTVRKIMSNRTPEQIADSLVQTSALMDSSKYAQMLDKSFLSSDDPAVELIDAIAPLFFTTNQQMSDFSATEETLNGRLARARFAVVGTEIPPDATFTLRLADGRIAGYEYNGTRAGAFTNYYGLYDHYYSYGNRNWTLPKRWVDRPDDLDLETPLNLVSTNDITGGNSGSPLLNKDLEVVGLVFDSNIEALPNEFLYTTAKARAVSVDARGIVEALRDIYGADRIVTELLEGRLADSDAQAAR